MSGGATSMKPLVRASSTPSLLADSLVSYFLRRPSFLQQFIASSLTAIIFAFFSSYGHICGQLEEGSFMRDDLRHITIS